MACSQLGRAWLSRRIKFVMEPVMAPLIVVHRLTAKPMEVFASLRQRQKCW